MRRLTSDFAWSVVEVSVGITIFSMVLFLVAVSVVFMLRGELIAGACFFVSAWLLGWAILAAFLDWADR